MMTDRKTRGLIAGMAGCGVVAAIAGVASLTGALVYSRSSNEPDSSVAAPQGQTTADEAESKEETQAVSSGPLKVGERVDYPGRDAHATVEQIAADGVHIRLDGCQEYLSKCVVKESELHRTATLPRNAEPVRALIGQWSMFEPGTFNTVTRGDHVFREWGLGAKVPPLTIEKDGSYVWVEDSEHTVRGRWRTDARVRGIAPKSSSSLEGNADHDGIVIRDSAGQELKVYRTRIEGKSADSIAVAQVCREAHYFMGTRIR